MNTPTQTTGTFIITQHDSDGNSFIFRDVYRTLTAARKAVVEEARHWTCDPPEIFFRPDSERDEVWLMGLDMEDDPTWTITHALLMPIADSLRLAEAVEILENCGVGNRTIDRIYSDIDEAKTVH